jgi:hypothetical protein
MDTPSTNSRPLSPPDTLQGQAERRALDARRRLDLPAGGTNGEFVSFTERNMNASAEELSHRLERVMRGELELKWNINCKGVYKTREDANNAYKAGGGLKDPPYLRWLHKGDYINEDDNLFYEGDNGLGLRPYTLITVKSSHAWWLNATAMCKCVKDCVPAGSTLHGSFNRMVEAAVKGDVTLTNKGKSTGGGVDAIGIIPLNGFDAKCCGECHYFRNRYADRMGDTASYYENTTTYVAPGEWTNRQLAQRLPPYIPPRTGTLVNIPGYYARETLMTEMTEAIWRNRPLGMAAPGTDVTSWLQNIDCDKCTESGPGDVITTT